MERLQRIDRDILRLIDARRSLLDPSRHQDKEPFQIEVEESVALHRSESARADDLLTPSSTFDYTSILRHIDAECRHEVRPAGVAFLGPQGSYSHLAAVAYFGESDDLTAVSSIAAVFDAVQHATCTAGIVPIENSTDGRVVDTVGLLLNTPIRIVGEVLVPIHHNLLSVGAIDQITEVHSKPQALSQCRNWLAANLPHARLVDAASTVAAAASAAGKPEIAVVASRSAARAYGLNLIGRDIEDNPNNLTRFAVLGDSVPPPCGDDKTTMLFQLDHKPGALADVMAIFKDHGLNLTWIESFPQPGKPNEYVFVIDFRGHHALPEVADAIDALEKAAHHVHVLGSYRRGRVAD